MAENDLKVETFFFQLHIIRYHYTCLVLNLCVWYLTQGYKCVRTSVGYPLPSDFVERSWCMAYTRESLKYLKELFYSKFNLLAIMQNMPRQFMATSECSYNVIDSLYNSVCPVTSDPCERYHDIHCSLSILALLAIIYVTGLRSKG